MDNKTLNEAIKTLKESKKRNFKQTIDLIVNLKQLDLKKPEHQVDFFIALPKKINKKMKICALVAPELADQAKDVCDKTINVSEFDKYADKKLAKKLAKEYHYFIAQATIMPKIASIFGRTLGPKGKMPNPKAGCIVPPNANLKPLYDKLQHTVRISARKDPIIQTIVGTEEMPAEDLMENINTVYNNLIHHLPQEKNNVKSVYIKYTMGKPIKLM